MGIGDLIGKDGMGLDDDDHVADGDDGGDSGRGGGFGGRASQKIAKRPRIKPNTVLVITEIGRNESERMDLSPRKQRVLEELKESGAMTLSRLSRNLGAPETLVGRTCEGLLYERCIQISGGDQ